MDDTTKEALSTLRSIITLPDQRDLGFPVDVVEKALEAATADNAALVEIIRRFRNPPLIAEGSSAPFVRHWTATERMADAALAQPHSGAPFLARLQPEALAKWLSRDMARHDTYERVAQRLSQWLRAGEEP